MTMKHGGGGGGRKNHLLRRLPPISRRNLSLAMIAGVVLVFVGQFVTISVHIHTAPLVMGQRFASLSSSSSSQGQQQHHHEQQQQQQEQRLAQPLPRPLLEPPRTWKKDLSSLMVGPKGEKVIPLHLNIPNITKLERNPLKTKAGKERQQQQQQQRMMGNANHMQSRQDKADSSSLSESQPQQQQSLPQTPKKGGGGMGQQIMGKAKNNKQQMKAKKKPWDPGVRDANLPPVPLKVELPVFVASLPKSGTTSIWQYFKCGGRSASHQWIKLQQTGEQIQSGVCVRRNVNRGRPPFEGCGEYDVYADTGFALYTAPTSSKNPLGGSDCYYPSVDALQDIYNAYPNATIILIVRDTVAWYHSVASWGDGSLLDRWKPCNATGFPGWDASNVDFQRFYDWHNDRVRQFALDRPSLRYVEVSLESPDAGRVLERQIGIPADCWGVCTPYSKFCQHVVPPPESRTEQEANIGTA